MRRFDKNLPSIYTENGYNFLLLEDGKKLKDIIKTVLVDDVNDNTAIVTIEIRCNICSTKEEAIEKYNFDK